MEDGLTFVFGIKAGSVENGGERARNTASSIKYYYEGRSSYAERV